MTLGGWNDRALAILERRLAGEASSLLLERLRQALAGLPSGADAERSFIRRVRATLRLFISEELAEDVCRELGALR